MTTIARDELGLNVNIFYLIGERVSLRPSVNTQTIKSIKVALKVLELPEL